MVDASYLEGHKPAPPALKRFLDQSVIPVAINAAGGVEAGIERLALAVRKQPAVVLGGAVLIGLLGTHLVLRTLLGRGTRRAWLRS